MIVWTQPQLNRTSVGRFAPEALIETLLIVVCLCSFGPGVLGQVLNNNDYLAAEVVEGAFGGVSGSNQNAKIGSGESNITAAFDASSIVLFRWEAPTGGGFTLLLTSEFDSQLAVYSNKGGIPGSLESIGEDDIGDTEQRHLEPDYFLKPTRAIEELAAFGEVYPISTSLVSNNLLTQIGTSTRDEIVANDAAALGLVVSWLIGPTYCSINPFAQTTHDRFATFLIED